MSLLFAIKGFDVLAQCLIRMRIAPRFDLTPELLNYEGLTGESQPLRDLFFRQTFESWLLSQEMARPRSAF